MKKRAYTIFELMTVLSIILILAGLSGLSFSNYSKKSDYRVIGEKIPEIFRLMSLQAYKQNSQIDIIFDFDNNLILFKKNSKIIEKFKLPKRYTYEATTNSRYFNKDGNIHPMFSLIVKENNIEIMKFSVISTDKFVKNARIIKYIKKGNQWEKV